MVSVFSIQALQRAQEHVQCRQKQLQQLAIYYNHNLPPPPILVAHGLEGCSKLDSITALLRASEICHGVVKSKDCLSQRHLLTKVFAVCVRESREVQNVDKYDRVDNLNSLLVNLQKLFKDRKEKFVLVIDGIDRQRGASQTLLPALARLGDLVPNLSLILTSSSSQSIPLHRSGIPYIHFPPYTRAETVTLITKQSPPMPSNLPTGFPDVPEPQLSSVYKSFVITVYDTLITHTSSTSIQACRQTCDRLWPRFIWPMLSGEDLSSSKTYKHPSNAKWDFARLLGRNRSLFQREGEKALLSHLTSDSNETWTFDQLVTSYEKQDQPSQSSVEVPEPKQETPLLKSFSTLLLVSSYLASHTPPKHDIILFSRLSSSSTNKRKYLTSVLSKSRTGGVRKTPTKKKSSTEGMTGDETPSKKRKSNEENGEGLAGGRTPKSTRLLLEKTSNIPRPFTLERAIAILRAIHPDGLPRTKGTADRVYQEMAELERLRLVMRCTGGIDGTRAGDDGILEEKWKINVGRDFVMGVGRYWGMGLEGWEID